METRIFDSSEKSIKEAAELIKKGNTVIFPTEKCGIDVKRRAKSVSAEDLSKSSILRYAVVIAKGQSLSFSIPHKIHSFRITFIIPYTACKRNPTVGRIHARIDAGKTTVGCEKARMPLLKSLPSFAIIKS